MQRLAGCATAARIFAFSSLKIRKNQYEKTPIFLTRKKHISWAKCTFLWIFANPCEKGKKCTFSPILGSALQNFQSAPLQVKKIFFLGKIFLWSKNIFFKNFENYFFCLSGRRFLTTFGLRYLIMVNFLYIEYEVDGTGSPIHLRPAQYPASGAGRPCRGFHYYYYYYYYYYYVVERSN